MNGESFKVIERSDPERVVEIAAWLIERGYKLVSKVTQMSSTGLFTQVMHWEPRHSKTETPTLYQ